MGPLVLCTAAPFAFVRPAPFEHKRNPGLPRIVSFVLVLYVVSCSCVLFYLPCGGNRGRTFRWLIGMRSFWVSSVFDRDAFVALLLWLCCVWSCSVSGLPCFDSPRLRLEGDIFVQGETDTRGVRCFSVDVICRLHPCRYRSGVRDGMTCLFVGFVVGVLLLPEHVAQILGASR